MKIGQTGQNKSPDINQSVRLVTEGVGSPKLFPALGKPASILGAEPTSGIRVILGGERSVATNAEPSALAMPSFAWELNDNQIAAVLAYIRKSWGAGAAAISPRAVSKQGSKLANRDD